AGGELGSGVGAGHVLNANGLHTHLFRTVLHHEPAEDFAVQAAQGGGGEHALGRAAGAHHGVDARAGDTGRDTGGEVAIGDETDARAGLADIGDEFFMARTIEHHHYQIVDAALQAARDRLQVVLHRRVELHGALGGGTDHNFF